jgi:dTDP-4-dehydrorhamnose 3,5-epimerase
MRGCVMDVAVDIRESSPTYGQYVSVILSEENNNLLWLPEGIAHGFISLADNTIFHYKCTDVYNKESEASIKWDDEDLNIKWGSHDPIVSDKDQLAKSFKESKGSFS